LDIKNTEKELDVPISIQGNFESTKNIYIVKEVKETDRITEIIINKKNSKNKYPCQLFNLCKMAAK